MKKKTYALRGFPLFKGASESGEVREVEGEEEAAAGELGGEGVSREVDGWGGGKR